MVEGFQSSDSLRGAKPLPYAQHVQLGPVALEMGATLSDVTVCYETYGTLNGARDNAVLICHALSGDSHVARHNDEDDAGWWDLIVGPGKPIDTNKYFVICPNILGGCRGTTGPNSINPATGRRHGRDFPTITIHDMADVQAMLLRHLGIGSLLSVVGGSMGGMLALSLAVRHPEAVRGVAAIATAPRFSSQSLAFDVIGRNVILRDPNFFGGDYYDHDTLPSVGLAIARMIAHITYLSPEAMQEKFEADRYRPRDVATEFEKRFSIGSYLGYQGDKFVERFDANSYLAITTAIDLFDLGATHEQLRWRLGQSTCRWLVVSFTSDWLFPPSQSRDIVSALLASGRSVSYCNVKSACGHDAFLLPHEVHSYGTMLGSFLSNLQRGAGVSPALCDPLTKTLEDAKLASPDADETPAPREAPASPTNIFTSRRLDYERIMDLIPPGGSVLDLGCGAGGLLARLSRRGTGETPAPHGRLMGVELDERAIVACVHRGLDVIQADLNQPLPQFDDGQFDTVVLSQTLQAVRDVEGVIAEMLRIGKRCVVSFPNFGYRKLRQMLFDAGRAPESSGILRYKWYNTPNIRFFSITDFEEFCREKTIHVQRCIALDTEAGEEILHDPNLNADLAIFAISRY